MSSDAGDEPIWTCPCGRVLIVSFWIAERDALAVAEAEDDLPPS